MKAFDELENQHIEWVQKSVWQPRYDLQTEDGAVLAHLEINNWTGNADLEALGNRWRFKDRGFFNSRTEVISVGTGDVYATYSHNKNRLTLRDGQVFRFKQVNFWATQWSWLDADNRPVVGFETSGVFRFNSGVSLEANSAEMRGLPVLVYLGWYLLIKQRQTAVVIAAT